MLLNIPCQVVFEEEIAPSTLPGGSNPLLQALQLSSEKQQKCYSAVKNEIAASFLLFVVPDFFFKCSIQLIDICM